MLSTQEIRELRQAHVDLLKSLWSGDDESRIARVREFIATIRRAGATLESEQDRDCAQELLDQWIAQLMVLAPSTPESDLSRDLDAYKSGDGDGAAVSDIRQKSQNAREQIRLTALARQWLESGREEGYLINGRAAKDANQFRDNDPLLAEFVTASKGYEFRTRVREWIACTTVILLFAALSFLAYKYKEHKAADVAAGVKVEAKIERLNGAQIISKQDDSAAIDSCKQALVTTMNTLFAASIARDGRCSTDLSSKSAAALNAASPILSASSSALAQKGGETSGTIWLGNDDISKVQPVSKPIALKDLTPGTKIRATTTLALRSGFPDDKGQLSPSIGVVPVRTELTVQDRVREVQGQYFAMVSFPSLVRPLVFIQYTDANSERAKVVQQKLKDAGFTAPGVQAISKKIRSSVKYDADCIAKWPTIEKQAKELADAASGILTENNMPGEPIKLMPIKYGCKVINILELWIAFEPSPTASVTGPKKKR